jgi:H+/Cl- antiporter ClcA
MSHGVALLTGVVVGFVGSVLVRLPPIDRPLRDRRVLRVAVHLTAWLGLPVIVAAFMPTFVDALLVLLGNAVGGALSMLVTLPMALAQRKRPNRPVAWRRPIVGCASVR